MGINRAIGLVIAIVLLRFVAPQAWSSIDQTLTVLAGAVATVAESGAAALVEIQQR